MTLATYFYVHQQMFIFPAILVGVVSFFVADIFFNVFSMAIDTYFFCACKCFSSYKCKFKSKLLILQ